MKIITTHNLGKYILKNKKVPTPIYRNSKKYNRYKKTLKF